MIEILYLLLFLAVCGFVVYLIVTFVPMTDIFKTVIPAIAAIAVIIWFLAWMSGNAQLPKLPRFP